MERDRAVILDGVAAFDIPAHAVADNVFAPEGVEITFRGGVEDRVVEEIVEDAIGKAREAGVDCWG